MWERYRCRTDKDDVGNNFALCPLDSVRGAVQLVCADEIMEHVIKKDDYKASITRTVVAGARDTW